MAISAPDAAASATARPDTVAGVDLLLVISHMGAGGAQRVAATLANAWAARGHKVALLALTDREADAYPLDPRIRRLHLFDRAPRWTVLHLAGALRLARRLPQLRRIIRRSGARTVVSFIRAANVKVLMACLGLDRVRIVISERNDPERQQVGWPWDWLSRLFYKRADLVTANSRGALESMAAYVPRDKLAYVPNPMVPGAGQAAATLEGPHVLAVGRLTAQKGYDLLLRAFAGTGGVLDGWRLSVLGDGPLREDLERQAEALGLSGHIVWHGQVADPHPYYAAAQIFVLSSRYEGSPNALLEAMDAGLPCIVNDASPGPLELIEHEANGLVVPSGDAAALAAAMVRLAGDEALRRRLGQAARRTAAGFHLDRVLGTWDRIAGLETA